MPGQDRTATEISQQEPATARKRAPAELAKIAGDLASGSALGSVNSLRQIMLDAAGVSVAELARITRRVVDKNVELLDAKRKVRLVVSQGRDAAAIVESFEEDDTAMQARAAAELTDILGIKPSRSQAINTGGGPVNIRVSFAERPQPKRIEVIEVK